MEKQKRCRNGLAYVNVEAYCTHRKQSESDENTLLGGGGVETIQEQLYGGELADSVIACFAST